MCSARVRRIAIVSFAIVLVLLLPWPDASIDQHLTLYSIPRGPTRHSLDHEGIMVLIGAAGSVAWKYQ